MGRARDRSSAEGLLPRMEARPWSDGKTVSYRYHPAGGRPMALGTDRDAALRRVLDLNGQSDRHGTLGWVWEQWLAGARWQRLAAGTQADYRLAWKQIDKRLGHLQAAAITAPMVARYVHVERAGSPRRADIEKALMSNLFKHAIRLGVGTTNPTVGVEPHGSEASDVMPQTLVLKAFLDWLEPQTPQRKVLAYAAEFASLVGSRQVEFLDLSWTQVDRAAGVIRLKRAKQRGKKRGEVIEVVKIQPRLAALLDQIAALNRDCLYLFPNEDNNAYSARGFKTLWQRCVKAAIAAKVMRAEDRFNFHALRRYYATMHKAATGSLPDLHANRDVTARVYDASREVGRSSL
jgi:integrase